MCISDLRRKIVENIVREVTEAADRRTFMPAAGGRSFLQRGAVSSFISNF
jgi:hypothetical protein